MKMQSEQRRIVIRKPIASRTQGVEVINYFQIEILSHGLSVRLIGLIVINDSVTANEKAMLEGKHPLSIGSKDKEPVIMQADALELLMKIESPSSIDPLFSDE